MDGKKVYDVKQLPAGPFQLIGVMISGRDVRGSALEPLLAHRALTQLTLDGGEFDSATLIVAARLPRLEYLGISSGASGPIDWSPLGKMTTLVQLTITVKEFGDADIEQLARLPKLYSLVLAKTSVTDAAIDRITKLGHLHQLDLTSTGVSAEGLRRLKAAKPEWEVANAEVASATVLGPPITPLALVARPAKLPGVRSWTLETVANRNHGFSVTGNKEGNLVASGGQDGAIRIFRANDAQLVKILETGLPSISSLRWHPERSLIACARSRGAVEPRYGTVGSPHSSAAGRRAHPRLVEKWAEIGRWTRDLGRDGPHVFDYRLGNEAGGR
jgi:hypothetical protein